MIFNKNAKNKWKYCKAKPKKDTRRKYKRTTLAQRDDFMEGTTQHNDHFNLNNGLLLISYNQMLYDAFPRYFTNSQTAFWGFREKESPTKGNLTFRRFVSTVRKYITVMAFKCAQGRAVTCLAWPGCTGRCLLYSSVPLGSGRGRGGQGSCHVHYDTNPIHSQLKGNYQCKLATPR